MRVQMEVLKERIPDQLCPKGLIFYETLVVVSRLDALQALAPRKWDPLVLCGGERDLPSFIPGISLGSDISHQIQRGILYGTTQSSPQRGGDVSARKILK